MRGLPGAGKPEMVIDNWLSKPMKEVFQVCPKTVVPICPELNQQYNMSELKLSYAFTSPLAFQSKAIEMLHSLPATDG